ncbi:phage/plasmid primase, P4 family [Novosphingobium sp. HII-3]|uniref:phage/plasmid primase, P4 family n=1 Tax=Novosphingobium sp. HII-3 TaxID=2075565 RepID=UPI002100D3EC|nr:phage/plasmid primase, P4 family [Novosphingobium sp. HII-3]
MTVRTGKGLHVYFQHPGDKLGNRAGVRPGWDIRGDGGYVVAPGSTHPSGAQYAWQDPPPMFDLAPMPDWLVQMLAEPEAGQATRRHMPTHDRTEAWAQAALRNELADLANAPQGQRNKALNNAALKLAQIVAGGHLGEAEVKRRLAATATAMGLEADEIGPTIDSGFAKGSTEPRNPPERERANRSHKNTDGERADPETGEIFTLDGDVSEDAIAQAFTSRFRDTLRYDHTAKAWFEWDGTRWKMDGRDRAFSYARELGRILSRGDKGERGLRRASVAAGAERFARADPVHAVDASVWDTDLMALGTPAGTLDLKTGKLRRADPVDYITKQTAVAPESGEPALWLAFLRDALSADDETIRFLQQWCGYALTGLTTEHALFFIYGPGGNGKSVFLNTIAAIMGDYAVTAAMETFTAAKFDRHSTELAMLAGARMVTASETEEGRAWAEAKVKQMTGGDPITARFMHKDNFTFRPQFKLTIAGNHAPTLRNVDDAMRRRFNIVPFTVKPAKPDRQLEEKLRAEHGKILGWAIKGCLDWQEHGLVRPAAVTEATGDYFESQDLFGQWIAERCTVDAGKWELPARLYSSWSSYAREVGEEPGTSKSLSENLAKRGFRRAKTNGLRVYRGLEAKAEGLAND